MNWDPIYGEIEVEVDRQDRTHPAGYPATRDGVFLGITTAVWELEREALTAWNTAKRSKDWQETREELVQAVGIILRTIRSIDKTTTDEHMDAWVRGEMTHVGESDDG
jgi:hypothetical protein